MTGKQLKNSILQWAIQGKLVPQDPNDEPASVLLEKIRAEKARLIKEWKIKKDKKESIIYRGEDNSYYEKFADGLIVCIDDEVPFEIPSTWEWRRLSSLFQINPKNTVEDNADAAFIPMEKIDATYQSNFSYSVRKWHEIKSGFTHFADGDVAFAKITPCFQNRKSMILKGLPNGIGAGTTELKVLRTYGNTISTEYLLFFLESPYFVEEAIFKGTANQQRIISGYLENKLFPIPPQKEQQRIVDIINASFTVAETYSKAQEKLDSLNNSLAASLRKSILQEAIQGKLVPQDPNDEPASFLLQRIKDEKLRLIKEGKLKKMDIIDSTIFRGDDNKYFEKKGKDTVCIDEEIPFEIPATWEWVRLSDVVQVNPKNDVPDNTLSAFIPMERIDATYLSSFTYTERKWGDIKAGFTHFADGDVAFAKITPCFQNRKSMILKGLPNGIGAGTTELKVLRPYAETIDREYLLFFLESSYFVEEATFKGTANQQRIISGYMENKLFPLPPLSEQRRISEKIKKSYKRIEL
ncbi:restriction endonuclease subunit S [Odoribacter splanchnicus]|uniref:Restriction endonuclease subunit S n=1 Tax=Odoribacter splanchnicus TaxID=28118 RepID=A0A413IBL1_9BACT|nr:restriction endonuclease subunit S [Odoribacter splanchnicus]RGY06426.1 restriction endonuclease subunit S [Odoribacter splanchnicus]